MVNSQDLLLASTFELVDHMVWMASTYDDRNEEQRAFVLFVTQSGPRRYFITYAEIDPDDCFGAPVFLQELYAVELWATEEHLMPLVEQIKAAILSSSVSSPAVLPHMFGGVYKNQVPTLVYAPRSNKYD